MHVHFFPSLTYFSLSLHDFFHTLLGRTLLGRTLLGRTPLGRTLLGRTPLSRTLHRALGRTLHRTLGRTLHRTLARTLVRTPSGARFLYARFPDAFSGTRHDVWRKEKVKKEV